MEYNLWNQIDQSVVLSDLKLIDGHNEDEIILFDSSENLTIKLNSKYAEKKEHETQNYEFYINGSWIRDLRKSFLFLINIFYLI